MRALGIDYGARRIGLAVSDDDGRLALPVGTVERSAPQRDFDAIAAVVEERRIECLVVGLPIHMSGRAGPEAAAAERFARNLGERLALPVHMVDERWTTALAERSLNETGRRGRRKRAVVDSVAATLLLRTWLEQRQASLGDSR